MRWAPPTAATRCAAQWRPFPQLFDGGVDWEGTFVDEHAPNLLTDLPPAILNFDRYAASGFDPRAARPRRTSARPATRPTSSSPARSLWGRYWAQFWEVTQCQWQKRLDPAYDTYGSGTGTYNYVARLSVSDVGAQVAAFATTGRIRRPLSRWPAPWTACCPSITTPAPTRATWRAQRAADKNVAAYRLYEVQNGNHIETYADAFPRLEIIEPHAQRAFDLLVESVERRAPLPPDRVHPARRLDLGVARAARPLRRPARALRGRPDVTPG